MTMRYKSLGCKKRTDSVLDTGNHDLLATTTLDEDDDDDHDHNDDDEHGHDHEYDYDDNAIVRRVKNDEDGCDEKL